MADRTSPADSTPNEPRADTPIARGHSYRVDQVAAYAGACDGSGSVALDDQYFVAVNDEDAMIHVYHKDREAPVVTYDCRKFLELNKNDEPDLEAAARIGNRLYFIGSHARSRDGKKREDRRQFFGIQFQADEATVALEPIGKPYTDLVEDLEEASTLEHFDFNKAADEDGDSKKGLNIEGLCSTPEGYLLIGFRGPIRDGKAIVLTLQNPDQLLEGKRADWGPSYQLDLDGMGIRGLGRTGTDYILIGERSKGGKGAVYLWDGVSQKPLPLQVDLDNSDPESVVIYPSLGLTEFQLLLDDGNSEIAGRDCKGVKDPNRRRFRSFRLRWLPI